VLDNRNYIEDATLSGYVEYKWANPEVGAPCFLVGQISTSEVVILRSQGVAQGSILQLTATSYSSAQFRLYSSAQWTNYASGRISYCLNPSCYNPAYGVSYTTLLSADDYYVVIIPEDNGIINYGVAIESTANPPQISGYYTITSCDCSAGVDCKALFPSTFQVTQSNTSLFLAGGANYLGGYISTSGVISLSSSQYLCTGSFESNAVKLSCFENAASSVVCNYLLSCSGGSCTSSTSTSTISTASNLSWGS